jgi:hypothetical protein
VRGNVERQARDDDLREGVAGDVDAGPEAVGAERMPFLACLNRLVSSVREWSLPWTKSGRSAAAKSGSNISAQRLRSV